MATSGETIKNITNIWEDASKWKRIADGVSYVDDLDHEELCVIISTQWGILNPTRFVTKINQILQIAPQHHAIMSNVAGTSKFDVWGIPLSERERVINLLKGVTESNDLNDGPNKQPEVGPVIEGQQQSISAAASMPPVPTAQITTTTKSPTTLKATANNTANSIVSKSTPTDLPMKGKDYTVGGKKEPDSWKVQTAANERNISTEIIDRGQNETEAWAYVWAISPDGTQHTSGAVHHVYSILKEVFLLDMLEQGKLTITGYDAEGRPVLSPESQKIFFARFTRFKLFAMRDAITKASRIAQYKMMNVDWRSKEEIETEEMEANLVQKSIAEQKKKSK